MSLDQKKEKKSKENQKDKRNNQRGNKHSESKNDDNRFKIKLLVFALLLVLIVLASVMILRLAQHKLVLSRGESYYNLRIAQSLISDPFLSKDPVQNTPYEPNPYHYLLALLLIIFPLENVLIFFPIVLGLVSAFIFFKLLILIGIRYQQAAYALIILSVTPAFIILFTGLFSIGFVMFLSLLISFIIIKHKKSRYELFLCILLFLILALTSSTGFLINLLFLLFICSALKRKLNLLFIPLIPSVLVIFLLNIFSNYTPRLLGFHSFEFRNILSVLRADPGFDLFLLALFFLGFIISWARTEQRRIFHLALIGLLALSLFNDVAMVFTSFIITVYCVIAILYLYNRKWELEIIRIGTFLLVLCSLVFSLTNQMNTLVKAQPDQSIQKSLLFLKGFGDGKVLTGEENGFLVEYYAGKNVLLDANSHLLPDYPEIKNLTDKLFRMARLKDAEPLLNQYDIRYVLITPDMKEAIWEGREQGLWFLVGNSESFDRIYSSKGVGIWKYNSIEKAQAQIALP